MTKNIYFKSDFTVILASEAQWGGCPFRLLFYTASPSRAFVASFDGEHYENCRLLPDGRLEIGINQKDGTVQNLMGIGTLTLAIEFYLDNDAFRDHICNQFIRPFVPTFTDTDGTEYEAVLDLQGSSTIVTIGTLPAFYQKGDPGITPEERQAVIDATVHAEEAAALANEEAEKTAQQTEASKKQMEEVNADYTKLKGDLQKAYTDTTAALAKDYTDKKAALDADYEAQKKALNDDYAAAKGALSEDYTNTKTNIASEYAQKQDALAADYVRDLKTLNDRMTAIESQYAIDKDAWQKQTTDFIAQCADIFTTNEAARQKAASDQRKAEDATFQQKEATRDAANQAALNAAETLAEQGAKLSELDKKTSEINKEVIETNEESIVISHEDEEVVKVTPDGVFSKGFFDMNGNPYLGLQAFVNFASGLRLGTLTKGYLVLSCDDGTSALIDTTIPLFKEMKQIHGKNIPFTMGLMKESDVYKNSLYVAEVTDMCNNYGCSIALHGVKSYTNYSHKELIEFIKNEHQLLSNKFGVSPSSCTYPNHDYNDVTAAIAGSFYGVCCTGGVNKPIKYANDAAGERSNMFTLYRRSLIGVTNIAEYTAYLRDNKKIGLVFWHDNTLRDGSAEYSSDILKNRIKELVASAINNGIEIITTDKIKSVL